MFIPLLFGFPSSCHMTNILFHPAHKSSLFCMTSVLNQDPLTKISPTNGFFSFSTVSMRIEKFTLFVAFSYSNWKSPPSTDRLSDFMPVFSRFWSCVRKRRSELSWTVSSRLKMVARWFFPLFRACARPIEACTQTRNQPNKTNSNVLYIKLPFQVNE